MVVVEQSTETLAPVNAGVRAGWWWCPLQQPVPQSLVVSLTMIVLDVVGYENSAEAWMGEEDWSLAALPA